MMNQIESYDDFLFENRIIMAINEGNLVASNDFLEKLKLMSKKNKIAEILFSLFNDGEYIDSDLPQNYIDVTATEDAISFLSDVRASKAIVSGFEAKGRSTVKIGRFVNSFLNNSLIKNIIENDFSISKKFTDKDIEEFVNLYKSTNVDSAKKFKLLKGEDIAEYYSEEKYASNRGVLGSSCMRDVDSDYFDIYVDNDKVCRLLVYLDSEDQLLGRALVWKLHEGPCDADYFMDRIYTSNDSDVLKFKNYAEEQGWMYKYKNNSESEEGLMFKYKGELVFGRIYVKLKDADFDSYPFVDTLSFLDKKAKLLSNVGFKNGVILSSTSGEDETCDACSGSGKNNCYYCDDTGYVDCPECDGDDTCKECNGDGYDDDGSKCDECKGKGTIKCPTCKNEGVIKCDECNGKSCSDCVGLEDSVIEKIKEGSWKEFKPLVLPSK